MNPGSRQRVRQVGDHWEAQLALLSFGNRRMIPNWCVIGKGIQSQPGRRVWEWGEAKPRLPLKRGRQGISLAGSEQAEHRIISGYVPRSPNRRWNSSNAMS